MQGRARPTICELYNWRYEKLGNLPHTSTWPEFRSANAGLVWDYQLIDVGDFNGVGESEPSPHFFQNLAEAEYSVALFMYMRLLGRSILFWQIIIFRLSRRKNLDFDHLQWSEAFDSRCD